MKKKSLFRRIAKIVLIAALVIIGIPVVYALVGSILSLMPVNSPDVPAQGIVVYLKRSNDVHADIAVPTRTDRIDWSTVVPPGDTKNGIEKEYLRVGWGSKEFYLNIPTWDDLTPGVAFRALAGMGGTALHTKYEDEPAEDEDCRRLVLTPTQYDELVKYILASGKRNDAGAFVRIDHPGDGYSDAYYEGTGRYTPFRTCNTWVNSALKVCGQRCCLWTPVQQPIFWQY